MLVLDVRERQDTAKELATAHDTPEARESEQKRSHTTVNVDPNRIYRYNTVGINRANTDKREISIGRLQILLSRRKTFAVIASGGNYREDHRRFSSSSRPSCVPSPISHNYEGILNYIFFSPRFDLDHSIILSWVIHVGNSFKLPLMEQLYSIQKRMICVAGMRLATLLESAAFPRGWRRSDRLR